MWLTFVFQLAQMRETCFNYFERGLRHHYKGTGYLIRLGTKTMRWDPTLRGFYHVYEFSTTYMEANQIYSPEMAWARQGGPGRLRKGQGLRRRSNKENRAPRQGRRATATAARQDLPAAPAQVGRVAPPPLAAPALSDLAVAHQALLLQQQLAARAHAHFHAQLHAQFLARMQSVQPHPVIATNLYNPFLLPPLVPPVPPFLPNPAPGPKDEEFEDQDKN